VLRPRWKHAAGRALAASALVLSPWLVGCGGHEARTLKMRTALDEGNPRAAIAAVDEELEVDKPKDLPKKLEGDNAILVLDRASIQQSLTEFALSERDFEASDKAIDMLDLAHNAGDTIGEYVFSGSVGKYQAPPYEKLLINTLNMLNYLETHDLNGARIEARRLSVIQKYYKDQLQQPNNPVLGLGSMLAGFTFEKSGQIDEALRYYNEALEFTGFHTLDDAVKRIAPKGSFRSPRITAIVGQDAQEVPDDDTGEVLFVVGYGRVPHKVAERIPIGLALTYFSGALAPNDVTRANEIAAQGLVTWINFPSLAPGQGKYSIPACRLDGRYVQLEEAVDIDEQVRKEWKKIEGKIIVSAITRMIARFAVGQGIRAAAGKDNVIGLLASLGAQATLTALDTPDTRSWETLPARVAVARMRLPAGRHRVALDARGWNRDQEIVVEKGGWSVVSLMALR
jgi:tetratricopeptide (TPR) repeat protein